MRVVIPSMIAPIAASEDWKNCVISSPNLTPNPSLSLARIVNSSAIPPNVFVIEPAKSANAVTASKFSWLNFLPPKPDLSTNAPVVRSTTPACSLELGLPPKRPPRTLPPKEPNNAPAAIPTGPKPKPDRPRIPEPANPPPTTPPKPLPIVAPTPLLPPNKEFARKLPANPAPILRGLNPSAKPTILLLTLACVPVPAPKSLATSAPKVPSLPPNSGDIRLLPKLAKDSKPPKPPPVVPAPICDTFNSFRA